MKQLPTADAAMLERLQWETFEYFLREANEGNGLIADSTHEESVSSIAATGLALTSYPVGVERGFCTRAEATKRTLTTLRFFHESEQSEARDATGYRGFYYHFLDMETGRRAWKSELSTIDTTYLLAGALTCAAYFDRETKEEKEIRTLADRLYRCADWRWAQNNGLTIAHGWKPERGFLKSRWEGYNEALILYALALASPTHSLSKESYAAWTRTYRWKKLYGQEFLYAGPLFIHQLSHIWIDFRGIQDAFMRKRGIDYFENSRRATLIQQQYAIRNPKKFKGYDENCWGITASDGPGPATRKVNGTRRRFYHYVARGVPFGPDDGTIAPWAAVSSLPFAPEIVLPTIRYFIEEAELERAASYGFKATFNPTFQAHSAECAHGWVSPWIYGLDQGPIVLMIENYRSELVWRLMRRCPYLAAGLRRAGFRNGWLDGDGHDDARRRS